MYKYFYYYYYYYSYHYINVKLSNCIRQVAAQVQDSSNCITYKHWVIIIVFQKGKGEVDLYSA